MRISPISEPGSLFKQVRTERKSKRKLRPEGERRGLMYLALVRRCPCLGCDNDPAGEAAHVRMSGPAKPVTGLGIKPADRYALPLCPSCHTRGPNAQHKRGEREWWAALGVEPLEVCERLNVAFPSIEAMRAVIFKAREQRKP